MCEDCEKVIETCWAEIRDLLNYHRKTRGPASEKFHSALEAVAEEWEEQMDEPCHPEALKNAADCLRAEMIATRCALVVQLTGSGPMAGMPVSMILGAWGGEALHTELVSRFDGGNILERLMHVPTPPNHGEE